MQTPMQNWNEVLEGYLNARQRATLQSACVGIAGAGGLGSNCAMLLARAGVGTLLIVDHDRVSVSNLNRQFYLPTDVGRLKVEALAERLCAINPWLVVHSQAVLMTAENLPNIFAACSIVVEAVDSALSKQIVLESLTQAGHFVVSASGMAGWGGPPMQRRTLGRQAIIVGDGQYDVSPNLPPLAPRVMIAAAMQANEVLLQLLGPCAAFTE